MDLQKLTTQSYLKFLEGLYQEISSIDEEKYGSDTIRPLCRRIDFQHQNFWIKRYSAMLSSKVESSSPAFLMWGAARMVGSARGIAAWDHETIFKKLLCYAQYVAVQDWVADVLAFTSPWAPGTWHAIFRNLKRSINMLLPLKPFVDQGCAMIFPGYDFCRMHWKEAYAEFEEDSRRTFRDDGDKIEAFLKSAGVKTSGAILKANMLQEAVFVKEQLGYIPASADSQFLATGSACLQLSHGHSFLRPWKENYEYAGCASLELISEIRRWGNQALFLEHLPDLDRMFDLLNGSTANLERISKYLREVKEKRNKAQEKRRKLLAAMDIVTGLASTFLAPIGAIPLFRSLWELTRCHTSKSNGEHAKDWACIVAL